MRIGLFVAVLVLCTTGLRADPSQSWAGPYFGVNAGGLIGRSEVSRSGTAQRGGSLAVLGVSYQDERSNSALEGAALGGQVGFNWLPAHWLLVGIEADGQWSNADQAPESDFVDDRHSLPWIATARLRLGYASDTWALYATGGLAVGQVDYSFAPPKFLQAPELGTVRATNRRWGWTAGGGAEVLLTDKWSVKFEYLFVDLEEGNTTASGAATSGGVYASYNNTSTSNINEHLVRAGLNVRLGD